MRRQPPPGFKVDEFYRGYHLYQSWEIFPGHKIKGIRAMEVGATLQALRFPGELTGKRVLEIAPWNGFYSFECVRRGAAAVVALGPEDPDETGFNKTMNLLELTNVLYVRDSVCNLSRPSLGMFDVVIVLCLLYHLRHPLLALDLLYECCKGDIFIDCAILDNGGNFVIPDAQKPLLAPWNSLSQLPLVYFSHEDKIKNGRDRYNWCFPTMRALRDWITTSGFAVEHEANNG